VIHSFMFEMMRTKLVSP